MLAWLLLYRTMKVGVTLYGSRISPRFDVAPRLLVVDTEEVSSKARQTIHWNRLPVFERIETLKTLNVDVLICGGIERITASRLTGLGIQLYSWVTGNAEEALALHRQGTLKSALILESHGKAPRRWRFRSRRGCPFDDG